MRLKLTYDSEDKIPAEHRVLYTERDGKFELTEVEGMKTQGDVDRVHGALERERREHGETKRKLKAFGDDLTPESVQQLRDENEDLKLQVETAGENPDEGKIAQLVEQRVTARLRPVERERDTIKAERDTLLQENGGLKAAGKRRTVLDEVRAATTGEKGIKVHPSALADIELLAERVLDVGEDGKVAVRDDERAFTPGVSPREWLAEIQAGGTRPHWFPGSVGAGARGHEGGPASGENPFDSKTFNLTKVAKLCKEHPERARALARAAKRTDLLPPELKE